MKISIFITELIFCFSIIVVGFVWIFGCVSGSAEFLATYGVRDASLWNKLVSSNITIDFYASLLLIFFGTYRLCRTCLSYEIKRSSATEDAASIGKYKELLDKGAITQEEFDAKKRELLNL